MKSLYNYLIILISFTLFICCKQNNKVSKNTSIIADTLLKRNQIDHFLFLKKGMNLDEIITILNRNSTNFSVAKTVDTSNTEEWGVTKVYPNIKFIDVYNYKIGNIVLDNFRVYFIKDHLFSMRYKKSIFSNNENSQSIVQNFADKQKNIILSIYNSLKEKYGEPDKEKFNTQDSLASGFPYIEGKPKSPLSNEFMGTWYQDTKNNISNTDVVIEILNSYDVFSNEIVGVYAHGYSHTIRIDFTDVFINGILNSYNEQIKSKENIINDSLGKIKKKLRDNL